MVLVIVCGHHCYAVCHNHCEVTTSPKTSGLWPFASEEPCLMLAPVNDWVAPVMTPFVGSVKEVGGLKTIGFILVS